MVFSDDSTVAIHHNNSLAWLDDIVDQIAVQGYNLIVIKGDDAFSFPDELDAILVLTASVCEHIYRQFQSSERTHPLIVLVTDDLVAHNTHADAVLPANPVQFNQCLMSMLELRRENLELRRELADAQAFIEKQRRLADEVEIIKNAIVRNVSHELKTPLLQVKSAVALLAEDVKDEKLADYAKGATARLETLVKNITLLGSSLDMTPSPVIVRDALEYAKRNLGRIWEHNDARDRIRFEIEADLAPVLADKQGLSTALQLLMDNALKFSKEAVDIHVKKIADRVEITVSDSGIGIEQEHLDRIFQTFYQVDSSSTRRYGGTGVGLAIVQLILDHHNTQIRVESEPGKGSTFSFTLPVVSI